MAIENIGLYPITIDVDGKYAETTVYANDNDTNSRGLLITLMKDGVPFDSTGINLRIGFLNSEGKPRLYDCETVDALTGKYRVFYPTEMLLGNGGRTVKLEIKAYDGNGALLNYAPLFVYINASEIHDDAIGGTNEASALVNALSQVQNIDNRFNSVNAQLAQITLNVKSFGAKGDGVTDDTLPIQAAIDLAYSLNGGTVLLPTGTYNYSSDLHVKESVLLKGAKKSILKPTVNSGARIITYHNSAVQDIEFFLPIDYNHSLFHFDNKYLASKNRKDKIGLNQGKVVISGNKIYKSDPGTNFKTRSETPEMVVFNFYAAPQPDYTILSGFWNVVIRENNISGIPLVAKFKTDTTGWINGCVLENNVVDHFETFVSVQRSPETLGIDGNHIRYNELQTRINVTKDIFEDTSKRPYGSNFVQNNQIWDMLTFTQARLGNMYNSQPASGYLINKERYTWILAPNRYYLLGRFKEFSSSVHHVCLGCTKPNRLKSEIMISGSSGGSIQRTHYGHDRSVNNFEFYTKLLASGETELYLKVPSEIEINVFFESLRSFVPSPIVYYTDISGVAQLTNISDAGPGSNIVPDTFDHTNNLIQFPMGVTYTPVTGSNPNLPSAPEGKVGTLITYKMTESGSPGYSWQEYKIFNSQNFYRRIPPTTSSWSDWVLI